MSESWLGAFTDWLAQRLAEESGTRVDDVRLADFARPAVGQSSDTRLFTARWTTGTRRHARKLVLRIQPDTDGIFDRPDAVREARVMRGLTNVEAVPVPRVHWIEPTGAVVGRPFFVMEQASGRVPGAKPSIHAAGWLPTLSEDQRRRLWSGAMDALVALHAVPWQRGHAFLRAADGDALDAHLERSAQWYAWITDGREFPVTDAALEFLRTQRPALPNAHDDVVVWGDARLGNMMFADDGGLRAMFDWELATVGPAEIDVAHWLVFDEFATATADVDRLPGFPDRAETIAEYERRSQRTLRHLPYFEVLQTFFLAATLIRQADQRVTRGELPADTQMGHGNPLTVLLAERIGVAPPTISDDYHRHRSART